MLKEQVQAEMVMAMKAKEQDKVVTLRSIMAAFTNVEKSVGSKVDELGTLKTLAKQRRQSIEMYEAAGKQDLADKEKYELSIIESFLPKQMTEDEIRKAVSVIIATYDEFDQKKMGLVIKQFNTEYPGQDGSIVASVVRSFL